MKKPHSIPEFTIIRVNQNNSKFFVASGSPVPPPAGGTPPSTGGTLGSMSISEEEGWGNSNEM